MEIIWSKEIDEILSIGRSLKDIGIRNWALNKECALVALDQLAVAGIAVLGGDVYLEHDKTLQSNYDNWYCQRENGESNAAFVKRSIMYSRAYVSNYNMPSLPVLFAIVPEKVQCQV
jgi:hypothetical protein